MFFFGSYGVLLVCIWSTLLFVVAPHLDIICRPAARTVRIGSFAALLQAVLPFAYGFVFRNIEPALFDLASPVLGALLFGSLALAAKQIVQGAPPPKSGGLLQ